LKNYKEKDKKIKKQKRTKKVPKKDARWVERSFKARSKFE